jgi:hypothetical protein
MTYTVHVNPEDKSCINYVDNYTGNLGKDAKVLVFNFGGMGTAGEEIKSKSEQKSPKKDKKIISYLVQSNLEMLMFFY